MLNDYLFQYKEAGMEEEKDFKFDKRAEYYDEGFEGKTSEKFYKLVIENIVLSEGMKLLDMGCGTGTILKRLSGKCAIKGFGIDVEEKMLEIARKKCPEMQIINCSCDNTPFEADSFDAIVACMAFHHFPNKEDFAKECARLLKKGGKLYIADPKLPFIIRKLLHGILKLLKICGRFFTEKEFIAFFSDYEFARVFSKSDCYAQIICLEKN